MTSKDFKSHLIDKFPFKPTDSQKNAILSIVDFLFSIQTDSIYILKGYAGTGKSTLIGYLVTQISNITYRSVLMAPTGRAAKVISNYSNRTAYTIHKQIYFSKAESGGVIKFVLKPNKRKKTLFIIDEASMISDESHNSKLFENGSLLDDLIQYVDSGNQCKLILVGDPAQLPPVHFNTSPALDKNHLISKFNKEVIEWQLEEVVRQEKDSSILINATKIRECINIDNYNDFTFSINHDQELIRLQEGNEILEALDSSLQGSGISETVLIVRSNKRANQYNQQIRSRILFLDSELSVGDQLMVVKNNYFWLSPDSLPGFIANGDLISILKIISYHDLYKLNFVKVEVQLVDYPSEKPFETVLLVNTLISENPALSYEESNNFYNEIQKDYTNITSKYKRFLATKSNPYFNALQVKYSYSITCHKSQGGQWKNVFIEYPYLPEGPNKEYFRWLYTGITRAENKLYLIGFPNEQFNL
mgnify:CR=1 FL=1